MSFDRTSSTKWLTSTRIKRPRVRNWSRIRSSLPIRRRCAPATRSGGIAVGINSDANFLGALIVAEAQGVDSCVATVFCDDNRKYLSTDLCSDEECQLRYLTRDLRLLGLRITPVHRGSCA